MSGKGSNRRKGDDAVKFRENYDEIFGKKGKEEMFRSSPTGKTSFMYEEYKDRIDESDPARDIDESWRRRKENIEENMEPIGKKRIYKIVVRDGIFCHYCGTICNIGDTTKTMTDDSGTVDHIIPKSKGGKDTIDNCVLSCRKCNSQKADTLPS